VVLVIVNSRRKDAPAQSVEGVGAEAKS